MRAALDTNLLVYAEGFGDPARVSATRRLLEQLSDADVVIPLQCLGELFRVLTGKAGRHGCLRGASAGQLGCPGAEVAAEGGARLLLTEDLHPGFCWRGVRVVNPLIEPADPLLVQLLG